MLSERLPLPLFPGDQSNILRVMAIGILDVVNNYVITQHRLGFAEVAEWPSPLTHRQCWRNDAHSHQALRQ